MATRTDLRQIIDFGDEPVFDALAYPTIVIATKRDKPMAIDEVNNEVLVLNWDSKNDGHRVNDFPDVFAAERFAVPQCGLKRGGWQLKPTRNRELLTRLLKVGQPLGEFCADRMYIGLKTGLNEAFVLSSEQREQLVTSDPNATAIISPFVRGKDIKRWSVDFAERYLIKIESSENVEHPWSGLPLDKAEKKFAKTYPTIYAWFTAEHRRQQLLDRSDQGHYFWELRSCAYWEEFARPKITFPDIALRPEFAWDTQGHLVDMTAFLITGIGSWVLAVLNSSVCYWFYDQISPKIQNGYFRFKAQYCKQIPIPAATVAQQATLCSLVALMSVTVSLPSGEKATSTPEYERLLNGLVYELFFP